MVSETLPLRPVPNAVAYRDRVALRLNRAGTEFDNPITGDGRYLVGETADPSGGGHNMRVSFTLIDSAETIDSAQVRAYDTADVLQETKSIKSLFTRNTTTLIATADLIAGQHLPTSDNGYRCEIVITTNANRVIRQQTFVRNRPGNFVVANGQETSETTPLTISMAEIDALGSFPASWSVSFQPTWNDEVARQHGANATALTGVIRKPYGGAATVEVFRKVGGDEFSELVYSERPCDEMTTMTWYPTSDGETQKFNFKFRSAEGSDEFVLGSIYLEFEECGETVVVSTSSCEPHPDLPPTISYVTASDPTLPGGEPPTFDPDGGTIQVDVDDLGSPVETNSDFADGVLIVDAYKGGTASDSGTADPIVVYLGSQEVAITSADVGTTKTINIDSTLADATLLVVTVRSSGGSTGELQGNSLFFVTDETDVGALPAPPTIEDTSPAPTFNFTTRTLSFTLNSFGFSGQNVTVHCKPLYGVIRSLSTQQSDGDIGIETGTAAQTDTILNAEGTGAHTSVFTFANNDVQAVAVWFSNDYGVSDVVILFDEGLTDSAVKYGPSISSASLSTSSNTNDTINFTLDDDGNANGTLTPFYIIVDSAQDQVQVTSASSVAGGSGSRNFKVNSGHHDIDGWYYVGIFNEQGGIAGQLLSIDNTSGSRTLVS